MTIEPRFAMGQAHDLDYATAQYLHFGIHT